MAIRRMDWTRRVAKPLVFLLGLMPLAFLVWGFLTNSLSANPISDLTKESGIWTLRFLVITLAITPVRKITGWNQLQRLRRMIGLFAFFYGCLHFTTYIYLDKFFEWQEILKDVAKRPFITAGFTAFALLVPLAATSPDAVVKWMGGKRWRLLHRLVYFSAVAGVIHYLWLVKADTRRPLTYGFLVFVLLTVRFVWYWKDRISKTGQLSSSSRPIPSNTSQSRQFKGC
jgi:sulfoxide reductase heme-binding subunit YedZ